MKLLKLKWFNYFLLVTLLNITLHICYLYMLLQAHDTLDHTANNIYSFEQVDNMIFLARLTVTQLLVLEVSFLMGFTGTLGLGNFSIHNELCS